MGSPKIVVKWPLAPLDLRTTHAICSTYEGRDKLIRLFQFGSRAVMGFTSNFTSGSAKRTSEKARRLMINLAGARRMFRWGRELPILLDIPNAFLCPSPIDVIMNLAQKVTILLFFEFDHYGWWKQVMSGPQRGTDYIRTGLKFLTLSSSIMAIYGMKLLCQLRLACRTNGKDSSIEQRQYALGIVRNAMLAFQVAHLSRLRESTDTLVGSLGVITSIIDILPVWPTKSLKSIPCRSEEAAERSNSDGWQKVRAATAPCATENLVNEVHSAEAQAHWQRTRTPVAAVSAVNGLLDEVRGKQLERDYEEDWAGVEQAQANASATAEGEREGDKVGKNTQVQS